jgi:hypothetical protein
MRRELRTLQKNALGECQLRMIGGTYIKPTASLGVMWAYQRGGGDDNEGRGEGSREKNGGESSKCIDKMSGQLPRPVTFHQSICQFT